jgi:hypothetical protein
LCIVGVQFAACTENGWTTALGGRSVAFGAGRPPRNASAVSDAPRSEWQVDAGAVRGRVRYSCLKEAAGKEAAYANSMLFAVMRKMWGIGGKRTEAQAGLVRW